MVAVNARVAGSGMMAERSPGVHVDWTETRGADGSHLWKRVKVRDEMGRVLWTMIVFDG